MTRKSNPKSGKRMLLALLATFMAPLAFAFWLYYGSSWRPTHTTNQGELIAPARPLPAISLPRSDGSPVGVAVFNGKWSLVVIGDGQCDARCQQTLVYTRQTVLGLGRLGNRLQRLLLSTGNCCDRAYLAREQPDLITLDAGGTAASALLQNFPAENRERMIFVVDPLGNLMMRYDASLDPKGLRADLKQLLDLSHIG
jgi:hypothetical protein